MAVCAGGLQPRRRILEITNQRPPGHVGLDTCRPDAGQAVHPRAAERSRVLDRAIDARLEFGDSIGQARNAPFAGGPVSCWKVVQHLLEAVLRHPSAMILVFVATLVATVGLFMLVPKGFIPDEDTGQIFAFTEAAQDISFDSMVAHQRAAADIVLKQPYVSSFMSSIGASNTSVVPNTGRLFIRLKPRAERPGVDGPVLRRDAG